jgi:uncharacterized protein (TIGR02246 family)
MDGSDGQRYDRAIRAVIESWFDAMEQGDLAALLALVTPDVIVKPPDSEPVTGRDALGLALKEFLQTHSEQVDYEVHEVGTGERLAFARISETTTITPKSCSTAALIRGIHLVVFRRQPGGSWLIARDFSSLIGHS